MSATTRSLLKLDQAYIAVGGRDHLTLIVDTLRDIALSRELDPPRCKGSELRCRGAELHTICHVYLPLRSIRMRID